jgi:hypothetical protein
MTITRSAAPADTAATAHTAAATSSWPEEFVVGRPRASGSPEPEDFPARGLPPVRSEHAEHAAGRFREGLC